MKYIYTLVLTLFISNQASAENWIKFELSENSVLNDITQPRNCFKRGNWGVIDSVDLDCIKNAKYLTIDIASYKTEDDTFSLKEIELLIENLPTNSLLIFNGHPDPFFSGKNIYWDWELNNNELLNKISGIYLSLGYDSVFNYKFPSTLENFNLTTTGKYFEIDSLNNIKDFRVNWDYYYSWADIVVYDDLELNIKHIGNNIETFYSSRYLKNGLPDLPENIASISIAIKNENKENILQKIKKYNNLQSLGFIPLKPVDSIDLRDITKAENISFSLIADALKSSINYVAINEECTRISSGYIHIKDWLLNEQLQRFYYYGEYITDTIKLPTFPENLKLLHLYYTTYVTWPIDLPTNLDTLYLTGLNINCLPTFPQSLKSFNGFDLRNIKCIPNETPWVKATAEWPICTDEQFVCDKDSFEIVNGKVYLDINNNGEIDSNDQLLPNAIISTDKNQLANSKENGTYGIILRETGAHQFSASYNHPSFKQSIPANVAVNYQEGQPIDSIHFLIQIENKNDVQINGTNLVARPGMSTKVVSFVENLSLENKSNLVVKILKPTDWTLEEAVPTGYSVSNDTIIWNNVALSGLKNSSFSVSSTLPATANILGDAYQYEMWVVNEGDITPENNYYSIIDTIIGSYDPNDKIVNHTILTPESLNSKELIYTIRFQNTGTDTAFKVVIIDTIIGNLDPASIRILGASHNYTWSYSGKGIATFVFDNILLPDSNINEPGSHGFVTLALRPSKDLAVGDSIYNRAGIYFDFNEPVITNHANTRIATVTPVYNHSNIPLSIYPNPAKNQVHIEWKVSEPAILNISDLSGKVIQTQSFNHGQTEINVSKLSKGLYIIQLHSGQNIAVSKLMVQ